MVVYLTYVPPSFTKRNAVAHVKLTNGTNTKQIHHTNTRGCPLTCFMSHIIAVARNKAPRAAAAAAAGGNDQSNTSALIVRHCENI